MAEQITTLVTSPQWSLSLKDFIKGLISACIAGACGAGMLAVADGQLPDGSDVTAICSAAIAGGISYLSVRFGSGPKKDPSKEVG